MSQCLDIETLELLVTSNLPEHDADEARIHLDACAACRRLLAEVQAHAAMAERLRAAAHAPDRRDLDTGKDWQPPPGYRLIREIGCGAQGVVYEVHQASTRRAVAMKVVGAGPLNSRCARRRFEREVELSARLKHPFIVTIHDSGTWMGCDYIVMDYVEGVRLDQVVPSPSKPRSIRETLTLFVKIAEGVNHAHQRGVIHRDLKPSNILVDAEGNPHILDFGLAKQFLDSDSEAEQSLISMAGHVFGTVAYMSPEHTTGTPEEIDVRSDVYALGVILYEMLARARPYDTTGSITGAFHNIVTRDPTRPSALRAGLDDEVDTIVIKALTKEKERRYQTAGDLAADVKRYLAGEAIEAKRDSTWYVLGKTLRRHRLPVAFGCVFLAVLLGALVGITALYTQSEANRRLSEWRNYRFSIVSAYSAIRLHEPVAAREHLATTPTELRDWTWRYLDSRLDDSLAVMRGHEGTVTCIAFDSRGESVISGGVDGSVRIWDVRTGRTVENYRGHRDIVRAVGFVGTAGLVVSADHAGIIQIWDERTGQIATTIEPDYGAVSKVTIGPDAKILAAGFFGGLVACWDWPSGIERFHEDSTAWDPTGLAFNHDMTRLLTCSADGCIQAHELVRGKVMERSCNRETTLNALAVNPIDETLALGRADGTMEFRNAASLEVLHEFRAHGTSVSSIAITRDGYRMATTSADRTVAIWDARSEECLQRLIGHDQTPLAVDASRDSALFVTGGADGTIRLWAADASDGSRIVGHGQAVSSARFSQDSRRLVTASADCTVRVWDTATGLELRRLCHPQRMNVAAFVGDTGNIATVGQNGGVRIWAPGSERPLRIHAAEFGDLSGMVTTPDGETVVYASILDHRIHFWRWQDDQVSEPLDPLPVNVRLIAISADGRWVAVGGKKGGLYVWDLPARTLAWEQGPEEKPISAMTFSTDSDLIATGSTDMTIRVWQAAGGVLVQTLRGHSDTVTGLAFNPDGTRLASAACDKTIRIWDLDHGQELVALHEFDTRLGPLDWSRDGETIACGDQAGNIHLFNPNRTASIEQARAEHRGRAWARSLMRDHGDDPEALRRAMATVRDNAERSSFEKTAALRLLLERETKLQRVAFESENGAWEIVKTPDKTRTEYEQARQSIAAACRAVAPNRIFLKTLGAADYRLGEWKAALALLQQVDGIMVAPRGADAGDLSLLAMAYARLGRQQEAQQVMKRVDALMQVPAYGNLPVFRALRAEAQATIAAGPDPAARTKTTPSHRPHGATTPKSPAGPHK